MKIQLLTLLLFISSTCLAQEICDNGIDDDGDGLIDLNDSDCSCNRAPIPSVIPNASFEDYTSCPYDYSQLERCTGWIQASEATTDYINTCGYIPPTVFTHSNTVMPFPDGNGIIGAILSVGYMEYLGSCLLSPLIANTNYQLTFDVTVIDISFAATFCNSPFGDYEPISVTLYGSTNCTSLPVTGIMSPNSVSSEWIILGSIMYTPRDSWGQLTINFTPSANINAIILGAPDYLPPSYASYDVNDAIPSICSPYFLFDDLVLNEASLFGAHISQSGTFCEDNLILTVNPTVTLTENAAYQWYKNGAAILGATATTLAIPAVTGNSGQYAVRVTDDSGCFITAGFMITEVEPAPEITIVQPTCLTQAGSIRVITPAEFYSFDNGATWTTNPESGLLPPGNYSVRIKNESGCMTAASGAPLTDPNRYPYLLHTTVMGCTEDGSITVNEVADWYSFDGGLTWGRTNTATLPAGTYTVLTRSNDECINGRVIVNHIEYSDHIPRTTSTLPSCGVGGTITVISDIASQYSFDDGLTWVNFNTASNLIPGEYRVRVKSAEGCISQPAIEWLNTNIDYLLTPFYSLTPVTCTTPGSIRMITPAASYSFDGGVTWTTNPVFTVTTGGSYSAMTRNADGCTSEPVMFTIDQERIPSPDITIVRPICTPGSITVTTPAAEYSFDNGATWTTNPVQNNMIAGFYQVVIRTATGCLSHPADAFLSDWPADAPNANVIQPGCSPGSITITTPASEYSFDGGTTWVTNPILNNLTTAQFYDIKIKDAQGCISNSYYAFIIAGGTIPPAPGVTVNLPILCSVLTGTLTVTTPANEYSFDDGLTWTASNTSAALPAGSYFVKTKDSNGCESVAAQAVITLLPNAQAPPVTTVIHPDCTVTTGTITVTDVVPFYSYDDGVTWVTNSSAALPPGAYYVKIKNTAGCESAATTTVINTFTGTPGVPAAITIPPACNTPTGSIVVSTIATEYSFDDGVTWQSSPRKDSLYPGTYNVRVKSGGCASDKLTVSLTIMPSLMAPQYRSVMSPCPETHANSFIEIIEAGIDYSFDGGITWTTNPILRNLIPAYTYQMMYRNAQGCISDVSILVTVPLFSPADTPVVSLQQPSSCSQSTGIITVTSAIPNYEYSFDNGVTWGSATVSDPLPPGTYYVLARNPSRCHSDPHMAIINAPGLPPVAPLVSIINPTCTIATGTITVTTPAAQYSFDDGVTWVTNSVTQLLPGSYQVKIKDSNGCESPAYTAIVDDTGKPATPAFITIPIDCFNTTGTITITSNAVAYSFDGITWISQNTMPGLSEGIYNIRIRNAWGCESDAVQVAIARTIVPDPVVPTPITYCKDATAIALTATGTNLLWYVTASGGSGTSTAPVPQTSVAGTLTYYVTQTLNGCESSRIAIAVTTLPLLLPPVTTTVNYCLDENTVALTATGTNLLWYIDEFGGTGSPVAPIPSSAVLGTFVYYVSRIANGCESTRARITVTISPVPGAPVAQTTVIYLHKAPTTTLTAQGSDIKWYNETMQELAGAPTPSSSTIGQRIYYATQTINQCESVALKIIVEIIPNYFAIKFPKYFTPNGDGTHETWNIINPGNEIRFTTYIFDRYGKLIAQIFSPGNGWDGTFKGHPLPASDYWFTSHYTEYGEQKEFKAHFSLLR